MLEDKDFKEIIGGGYDEFCDFEGRYRVVKGGRASKKSKTAALWYIYNMMKHPGANLLAVRKVYNSLKDSCFTELKWAIDRLGVADDWKCKISPLEMSYSKGGKIFFRGLYDAMRLASITTERGKLCWVWVEEAFEIDREDDFNMLDESVRGKLPPGLFKQLTLTFNPWSGTHWLKRRFFDKGGENVLALTTNHETNEWLDEEDKLLFERVKNDNPKRYKVVGLGDWGVADGLVYENWESAEFDLEKVRARISGSPRFVSAFGLDFGYTNDPSALCCMLVDITGRIIYVFDEMYGFGMSNREIAERITAMGYGKERIYADSAEPKSIDELRLRGLSRIDAARKGADSVNHGIQFIQAHKIVIHPRCVNFMKEVSNYSFTTNPLGFRTNIPSGKYNHLMDAMRYGLNQVIAGMRFWF
ncbi:MAG: PBSX family phage terminase large subunit [Oscillospiraceae bacterium]|nr:PBSX family phage terminase large subunit [Oscillospiraceae bacterium]